MTVVDQILVNWTALPGIVVLNDKVIERAKASGRHVAACLTKPVEEAEYIGEPGMCPVCHAKILEVNRDASQVLCAVCGVKGAITIQQEVVRFEVSDEQCQLSHMRLSGKFHHIDDLKTVSLRPGPNMDEIPAKLQKYKAYLKSSRPNIS